MKAFFAAFDMLPGALWALLLTGALAFGSVKEVQWSKAPVEAAEARADLSDYKATAAESARLADRAGRHEEARRTAEQGKALDEAAKETLTAQTDLAIARVTDERLRVQIAQFRAAADRAPRASALESSAATGDHIGVLAALLGRADKRAGILAAYADASRIAGKLWSAPSAPRREWVAPSYCGSNCRRQHMSDTSFEHHGHQVTMNVWQTATHWNWSYQIDDRDPVEIAQPGARSEEQALIEARHEAIAAIKALDAGP